MKPIDYTIISAPKYVTFDCPYCNEEYITIDFDNVDFKTDCWSDGAWVTCPWCEEEIELGDYDYD